MKITIAHKIFKPFEMKSKNDIRLDVLFDWVENPPFDTSEITETFNGQKNDLYVLYPYEMGFTENDCKAIPVNGEHYWGVEKRIETAKPLYLTMLVVDSDNGAIAFDAFVEYYKKNNITFAAYTSYNNQPRHERYRLMFPLEVPMPFEEYHMEYTRKALKNAFSKAACEATFNYLGFYFPCKTPHYKFAYNEGNMLDLYKEPFASHFIKAKNDLALNKVKYEELTDRMKNSGKTMKSPAVDKYLITPYNKMKGNGTSNSDLYKALFYCIRNGDTEKLNQVTGKAVREGWKQSELEQKINSIKKGR